MVLAKWAVCCYLLLDSPCGTTPPPTPPTNPHFGWKKMLQLTQTHTLKRKSSRNSGEGDPFEAAIGETWQLESKTMFCLTAVKTDSSGKAFRDAISKAVLRGSDRSPEGKDSFGEKKKRFGSGPKTGSTCAVTWGMAKCDSCVCVWQEIQIMRMAR